jgi:hypothetical protein
MSLFGFLYFSVNISTIIFFSLVTNNALSKSKRGYYKKCIQKDPIKHHVQSSVFFFFFLVLDLQYKDNWHVMSVFIDVNSKVALTRQKPPYLNF